MQDIENLILNALANNNLSKAKASRELYMHRNTVDYQVKKIKAKTGLNPCNFWDLVKLLGLKYEE